jgi:hypothetical protein
MSGIFVHWCMLPEVTGGARLANEPWLLMVKLKLPGWGVMDVTVNRVGEVMVLEDLQQDLARSLGEGCLRVKMPTRDENCVGKDRSRTRSPTR